MTDWSTIDSGFGRDTQPDEKSDQFVVAPDSGAGGWEAFDYPNAPEPGPATTPDRSEPLTATVTPAPDGGAGGWEAFDDPIPITGEPRRSTRSAMRNE